MCMTVLSACMHAHHLHSGALGAEKPLGITSNQSYPQHHVGTENQNLGPLKDQEAILTAEPSLQPLEKAFISHESDKCAVCLAGVSIWGCFPLFRHAKFPLHL